MKRFLFILLILLSANLYISSAQFPYNDVKVYLKAGDSLSGSDTWLTGVITMKGVTYFRCNISSERVLSSLQEISSTYNSKTGDYELRDYRNMLEDPLSALHVFNVIGPSYLTANGQNSPAYETPKYYVYKDKYRNYAISRDLKTMIIWRDGEEDEREYYHLADLSKYKSQIDNDFLYE